VANLNALVNVHFGRDPPTVTLDARAQALTMPAPGGDDPGANRATVWGPAIAISANGRSVAALLRTAEMRLTAAGVTVKGRRAPAPGTVAVDRVAVTASDGGPVQISVAGQINSVPFEGRGATAPLVDLIQGVEPLPLQMTLAAGDVEATFEGGLDRSASPSTLQGEISFQSETLARIGRLAGREWPPIGPVNLSGRLWRGDDSISIEELKVEVDRSRVVGRLDVSPQGSPRVRVGIDRAVIEVENLQAFNDYTPGADSPETQDATASARVIPATPLPTDVLRNLEFDFELGATAIRLVAGSETLARGRGLLQAEAGRLVASISGSRGSGAGVELHLEVDATTATPGVEVDFGVRDFDYGHTLRQLDLAEKVEGTIGARATLAGEGATLRDILAAADGEVTVTGGKGQLPRRLLELWGGGLMNALLGFYGGGPQTRLNCVAAHFTIENGLVESDLLLIDTADITIAGDAALELATEELRGVVRARPKRGALVQVGRPVQITGTLANPQAEMAGSRFVELARWAIGLSDPIALILLFGEIGTREDNPCELLAERWARERDPTGDAEP
jgi:hypothetical protein